MPPGLNASMELGAGGMRAQPVKIRRPLRSNGQRVVNDTQELSSNPFCICKYFSNLLSKVLGRLRLRARTAPRGVKSLWCAPSPRALDAPRGPKIAPRSSQDAPGAPKIASKISQKFDYFSVLILDRFWVVLGRQLGVIFGLFGAQVRPSSVQNAS